MLGFHSVYESLLLSSDIEEKQSETQTQFFLRYVHNTNHFWHLKVDGVIFHQQEILTWTHTGHL